MRKLIVSLVAAALTSTAFATSSTKPAKVEQVEYKDYSLNLTFNPARLLFGGLNLGVNFQIADNLTVGPYGEFVYYNLFSSALTVMGYDIGGRLNYFFTGPDAFSDSWYVAPFVEYSHTKYSLSGNDAIVNSITWGAVIGYQWIWQSGFNLSLGIGTQYTPGHDIYLKDADGNREKINGITGLMPAVDFTFGFAL